MKMAFYGKEFNVEKFENGEAFVNSLGVSEERKQKLLNSRTPRKIEKNADGTYTMTATPQPFVFKSGVEFEHAYPSFNAKITVTVDGNKVTQVQKIGDQVITIVEEFTDNTSVQTITTNKWDGVAKIYFKA